MSEQWYCHLHGQVFGPYSFAELQRYVAKQRIQPDTKMCLAGTEVDANAGPDLLAFSVSTTVEADTFSITFVTLPVPFLPK